MSRTRRHLQVGTRPESGVLLEVEGLKTYFQTALGVVKAVDGVSFSLTRGRSLGIVGESGSGKTILSRSIMGLLPKRNTIREGTVRFEGQELTTMSLRARRDIWGAEMAMIFQDPMTSLNPVMKVGKQIAEPLRIHLDMSRADAKATSLRLLEDVGIPEPDKRLEQYPHELSGGMRQRVAIARTLILRPRIILMDEPFGALDPPTRSRMQDNLVALWREQSPTIFFITHSIEEAVFLGDHILIFSTSPGTVLKEIRVPPPDRPSLVIQREQKFMETVLGIREIIDRLESSQRAGD
jgi:peptide/nickel transport system ATP-binding protein